MPRKNIPKQYAAPQFCNGKRRYTTKQEAEQIAEEQELLHFAENLKLSVYRCHLCGGWHLTRDEKSVY